MSNEEVMIAILAGVAVPFVVSLASRYKWSSATRQLFAFGITVAAAVGISILNGDVLSIPLVMATSVSLYQMLNKTGVFSSLEAATSAPIGPDIDVDNTIPDPETSGDAGKETEMAFDQEFEDIAKEIEEIEEDANRKPTEKRSTTKASKYTRLGGGPNG